MSDQLWCVKVAVDWDYHRDVDEFEEEFGYAYAQTIVGPFSTSEQAIGYARAVLDSTATVHAYFVVRDVDPKDVRVHCIVAELVAGHGSSLDVLRDAAETVYQQGREGDDYLV